MFSIDGVGEVGEFVRYGFKQKRFETNLRKWLDFLRTKTLRFIITMLFTL